MNRTCPPWYGRWPAPRVCLRPRRRRRRAWRRRSPWRLPPRARSWRGRRGCRRCRSCRRRGPQSRVHVPDHVADLGQLLGGALSLPSSPGGSPPCGRRCAPSSPDRLGEDDYERGADPQCGRPCVNIDKVRISDGRADVNATLIREDGNSAPLGSGSESAGRAPRPRLRVQHRLLRSMWLQSQPRPRSWATRRVAL
jgi:hypothetical protein